MTMALCLNCGEIKFGAFCPCPQCETASTGRTDIDIAFSDHNYSVKSLKQLGAVIKEIHAHCQDEEMCFWTFFHYVSENHPEILGIDLKPSIRSKAEGILAQCTLPSVEIEPPFGLQFAILKCKNLLNRILMLFGPE